MAGEMIFTFANGLRLGTSELGEIRSALAASREDPDMSIDAQLVALLDAIKSVKAADRRLSLEDRARQQAIEDEARARQQAIEDEVRAFTVEKWLASWSAAERAQNNRQCAQAYWGTVKGRASARGREAADVWSDLPHEKRVTFLESPEGCKIMQDGFLRARNRVLHAATERETQRYNERLGFGRDALRDNERNWLEAPR